MQSAFATHLLMHDARQKAPTDMRIIFLTHHFPPEVNALASRTFEHCREWQRCGHEVTVLTCAPLGKVQKGYRNRLWQREVVEGIDVLRVWTFLSANRGVVRRSVSFLSYYMEARNFRLFSPDENNSNWWQDALEVTNRAWVAEAEEVHG